jgi:hypothetical protein
MGDRHSADAGHTRQEPAEFLARDETHHRLAKKIDMANFVTHSERAD